MTKKFFMTKWEGMTEVGEGETVPMSKKLTVNQYILLSAIAMHQGAGGACDTTHSQLEGITPLNRKVIGLTMASLIEFRYSGEPVLSREEVVGFSKRKQWLYKLLPNPLFAVYGETWVELTQEETETCVDLTQEGALSCVDLTHSKEVKDSKEVLKDIKDISKEEKRMNKKETVLYFKGLLVEKGANSEFKFPAMYSKMKRSGINEILEDKSDEEIKKILETIANEYGTGQIRSDLLKYPLDMNVMTRKWVVEKAVQLVNKTDQEEEKKLSQIEETHGEFDERQEKAIDAIMERIRRGKSK